MLKKINLFIFVFSLFFITAQNNINIKENNVKNLIMLQIKQEKLDKILGALYAKTKV
jgi:hypothetical protein